MHCKKLIYNFNINNNINNINNIIKKECDVCYEEEHKEMYYTKCNIHSICVDCSIKLLDKPCPFCRK